MIINSAKICIFFVLSAATVAVAYDYDSAEAYCGIPPAFCRVIGSLMTIAAMAIVYAWT